MASGRYSDTPGNRTDPLYYGGSSVEETATGWPLIAVPGLIGYIWAGWGNPMLPPLSLGYVSVVGAAIIIPMSVLAAPLGVRAAHGMSRRALELGVAAFLALVATRLLMSLL